VSNNTDNPTVCSRCGKEYDTFHTCSAPNTDAGMDAAALQAEIIERTHAWIRDCGLDVRDVEAFVRRDLMPLVVPASPVAGDLDNTVETLWYQIIKKDSLAASKIGWPTQKTSDAIKQLIEIAAQARAEEIVAEHQTTHICHEKPKPNPYRHNHVCLTCSPDGINPGSGCINCRNTGMEQMPCVLLDKCPGPKDMVRLTPKKDKP